MSIGHWYRILLGKKKRWAQRIRRNDVACSKENCCFLSIFSIKRRHTEPQIVVSMKKQIFCHRNGVTEKTQKKMDFHTPTRKWTSIHLGNNGRNRLPLFHITKFLTIPRERIAEHHGKSVAFATFYWRSLCHTNIVKWTTIEKWTTFFRISMKVISETHFYDVEFPGMKDSFFTWHK